MSISRLVSGMSLCARTAVAAALLAAVLPAHGQTFQRVFGSELEERSEWVAQTSDGGYIICGFAIDDTLVIRLDATGAFMWASILEGVGFNIANRVEQTSDGGFILAGESSTSPPGMGITLAKLDSVGALLWANSYPGTSFAGGTHGQTAVDEATDGGFIVSGRLQGTGNASQAPVLMRTDSAGNLLWAKYYVDLQFGVNTYASFNDVHEVAVDGAAPLIVAAGHTAMNVTGQRDSLVVVTDATGNVIWAKTYGHPVHTDIAFGVDPAANGDYLVSGFAKSIGEGGGTYLLRTDSAGSLLWYKTFRFFNGTNSMEEIAGGDIILAGTVDDQAGLTEASIMRTDASGVFQWCMAYGDGGFGQDFGEAVEPTADGGFMLAAWTNSFGFGLFDVYAIRTDASGVSGCNEAPFTPILADDTVPVVDVNLQAFPAGDFLELPVTKAAPEIFEEVLCKEGCVDPPANLVAWWPLDETSGTTSVELIGGNDGTHVNGPTPLANKFVDNSLCFNGVNTYVNVPNAAALNVGQGDFSVDAWINTSQTFGVQKIVDKRLEAGTSVIGYSFFVSGGTLAFQLADGNGTNATCNTPGSTCTNYDSGVVVADGNWHFVAVTVDRDDPAGGIWYVDGVPVGTPFDPTLRPRTLTNTNPLRIGSRSSSVSGVFNGCIDEVELFDRVVDPSIIAAIFAAGIDGKCKPPCPPDINGDGVVDVLDLIQLLLCFGQPATPPCDQGQDVNGDGDIDVLDLIVLLLCFGQPCPCP